MSQRPRTRREFLADVGRGALVAGLGSSLASEWAMRWAAAEEAPAALSFGPLEPLVVLMQETPVERLLPLLVERLRAGTDLRTLVAAGALANARTFGGEDYVGYHAMMAIGPAYRMAQECPEKTRALPVLKVLYRNTERIEQVGGRRREVLRRVEPAAAPGDATALRETVRAKDVVRAERAFAALASGTPQRALNDLLPSVEDDVEVHRVALAYRSWDLLDVVGAEHAHTLLRQSVRYCARQEERIGRRSDPVRGVLASILDGDGLRGKTPGSRPADDAWVDRTSRAIFAGTPDEAADVAAAALAEGIAPAALGEAISLAANQLVLREAGRSGNDVRPGKPAGSVHGDSIGVHASDSANAWRNLASAGDPRNTFACLVLGAYQVARDRTARGGDFLDRQPFPTPAALERAAGKDPEALVRDLDAAIVEGDQARASALAHRYGELGHAPRPAFDVLLRHAVRADGALHAEKYYRTVVEDFAATRPAFRWRHVVALARVTASEASQPAAGIEEARRLLEA